jgi:hypothetical protein
MCTTSASLSTRRTAVACIGIGPADSGSMAGSSIVGRQASSGTLRRRLSLALYSRFLTAVTETPRCSAVSAMLSPCR